jgi:hypothetical protein
MNFGEYYYFNVFFYYILFALKVIHLPVFGKLLIFCPQSARQAQAPGSKKPAAAIPRPASGACAPGNLEA